MKQISSLFKVEPISKSNSERALILEWFIDNMKDKKGKKYRPAYIGLKVSHLKLADLYYMMSCAKEYERNGGEIGKYFFGSLKNR